MTSTGKTIIKIKRNKKSETSVETIQKLISHEDEMTKLKKKLSETTSNEGEKVLSHLGNYVEEPYHLIR
jgi:hypothetical protein